MHMFMHVHIYIYFFIIDLLQILYSFIIALYTIHNYKLFVKLFV